MSLKLRPMTDDEVARFVAEGLETYVAEYARSTGEAEDSVRRQAEQQHAAYFPGGWPAPGHRLLILDSEGQQVGCVWVGPHPDRSDESNLAWLYNIEVDETFRGRGYGRQCLRLVESHLAQQGVTELMLNVFGANTTARALYTSAGYQDVAVTMSKTLSTGQD